MLLKQATEDRVFFQQHLPVAMQKQDSRGVSLPAARRHQLGDHRAIPCQQSGSNPMRIAPRRCRHFNFRWHGAAKHLSEVMEHKILHGFIRPEAREYEFEILD
jgi:hypothetical protein